LVSSRTRCGTVRTELDLDAIHDGHRATTHPPAPTTTSNDGRARRRRELKGPGSTTKSRNQDHEQTGEVCGRWCPLRPSLPCRNRTSSLAPTGRVGADRARPASCRCGALSPETFGIAANPSLDVRRGQVDVRHHRHRLEAPGGAFDDGDLPNNAPAVAQTGEVYDPSMAAATWLQTAGSG
jgi:hypothetical protein